MRLVSSFTSRMRSPLSCPASFGYTGAGPAGTMAVTTPNPSTRTEPAMTSSHQDVPPCQWFSHLAASLDRRSTLRLAWLFLGAVLARGRRTVTSWIRAAGLSDQFRPCYTAVAAAGKKAGMIAADLVLAVVRPLVGGAERLTLALDDT